MPAAALHGTWYSLHEDERLLVREIVEALRPKAVLSRILDDKRRIPFGVRMPVTDSGSAASWITGGGGVGVSKLPYDPDGIILPVAKLGTIIVVANELARASDNLMGAEVPFDLGATVQIDLGGNQPL